MKNRRQNIAIMSVETLLKMFCSDRVILKTVTKEGHPIVYKNNERESIPDDIKKSNISKYSAYYDTICGESYTIIEADII